MSKRDTRRVYKRKLQAAEWSADQMPTKADRKAKRAERQAGRKEIREDLKGLKR